MLLGSHYHAAHTATVLITTKDRRDELRRALRSAVTQSGVTEVLVFDDGSTDGTSEMVRMEFPSVRIERSEFALGIIGARNRAVEMAKGSIVVTIDDDCEFQSPTTVEETLKDFEDERIGAVAIPHVNVNVCSEVYSAAPSKNGLFVTSEFSGGASAVRKEVFTALGGFNSALWRQGEEYDLCTRSLAHGYVVRCGTGTPILHFESANRNWDTVAFHGGRSLLLYAWCNVPLWALAPHVVISVGQCLRNSYKHGTLKSSIKGLVSAIAAIATTRGLRRPVPGPVYRLMRYLRSRGPVEMSHLSFRLASIVEERP